MPAEQTGTTAELEHVVEGKKAWLRDQVSREDWFFALSPECVAELDRTAATLTSDPLPTELLLPEDYPMPAVQALLSDVQETLHTGVGFAIIDRLDIDRYGNDMATKLYWLIASMIARPVAQKWNGLMVYDVKDMGKPAGGGVKVDVTNQELTFHTDNSPNEIPPDYVGLLCLHPALEGGVSKVASCYTLHNEMVRRHAEHLPRLYRPFLFDRQREHAEHEEEVMGHPIFEYGEGGLKIRLSTGRILKGYEVAGRGMDPEGKAALDALIEVQEDPGVWMSFHFERGQMQFLNNRFLGHLRTTFRDDPDPAKKRHLVRLWLRDHGRRTFRG